MPSSKTECTELSVGFGLLDLDPLNVDSNILDSIWEGSLTIEKYERCVATFKSNEKLYRRFHSVGINVRHYHKVLSRANIHSVVWEGPYQQAGSVSMAKDLMVANVAISVKDHSNVVSNFSPHRFFECLPAGIEPASRSENWYLVRAGDLYQELYVLATKLCDLDLPSTITEYHTEYRGDSKKTLGKALKKLEKAAPETYQTFNKLYIKFCHRVATESAEKFNETFSASVDGPTKSSVLDNIAKHFLRLGDTEYVLCGLEKVKSEGGKKGSQEFSVTIPDLSSWKRKWLLVNAVATPDLTKGQSVVIVRIDFRDRETKERYSLNYHVEIRWSHGKFGGNPEAKFYKDFSWIDVPFFAKVSGQNAVVKSRLLDTGGYGNVYEGKYNRRNVAIKELTVRFGAAIQDTQEDRQRFSQEVEIQSKLEHSNIVSVIVSDLSSMTPWFAMPLAHANLDDIIDSLPDDLLRVNHIFAQMLQAIKYAHDSNVIHRDIKPKNVLLFKDDHVRITDFGLGKKLSDEEQQAITRSSNNAYGSYGYAAPEQFGTFREADQRADIYALGQTLLHMVTGEEPLSPLAIDNVPQQYINLITRCTEEDPSNRFQTVDDVINEFENSIELTNNGGVSS